MLLEVLFIKKNVIYKENFTCKEKPGSVTKVKFVTKIKKHSYLFFLNFGITIKVVSVTIGNLAFCLALHLSEIHFRCELQHVGNVSE